MNAHAHSEDLPNITGESGDADKIEASSPLEWYWKFSQQSDFEADTAQLEVLKHLERLHDELAIPLIYVSHAPDEVARLADHLVLLDNGRVVASGGITETLARADLPPVFADDAGVVLVTVVAGDDGDNLTRLDFSGGHILVGKRPEPPGHKLRCRIHARDVSIALDLAQASSILNILPATVTAVVPTDTPGHVLVQLRVGDHPLLARITERSCRELGIAQGLPVWAQVKAVALLA